MGEGYVLKRGSSKSVILLFLAVLFVSVGVIAASNLYGSDEGVTHKKLAGTVNGVSINSPYIKEYIQAFKNFSEINHEKVTDKPFVMTVGAKNKLVKGFEINNELYFIHLIYCDRYTDSCAFRVNGVPTNALYNSKVKDRQGKQLFFNLNKEYRMIIESIQFDYCDNRRFCDLYFDTYDVVDVKLVPR